MRTHTHTHTHTLICPDRPLWYRLSIDQKLMKDAIMQMWLHAGSNEAGGCSCAEWSVPEGDRNLRVSHTVASDTLG